MITNGYDAITVPADLAPSPRSLPQNVRRIRTMMSAEECALLYSLARNRYSGEGCIVDAGIFLGGSTVALGQGVLDAGTQTPEKPIVSFDQALVTQGMLNFFERRKVHPELAMGDDLRPIIRENTADVASLVDYRFGDILAEEWDSSQPVEICFLDILKTPAINRFAIKNFFPALMPGKSYVVHQDYFYHRHPYIKIFQEFFSDYFEFIGIVKTSAVFRLVKPIPGDQLARDLFEDLDEATLWRLHSQAEGRAGDAGGRRLMAALSRVELKLMMETPAAAREELIRVQTDHAPFIETDATGHHAVLAKVVSGLIDEAENRMGAAANP